MPNDEASVLVMDSWEMMLSESVRGRWKKLVAQQVLAGS